MSRVAEYTVDHPGTFIKEEIEERGWTQLDLAYILGRQVQAINPILSGKRGISVDMAKALGMAFDMSPEFFINLQKIYDLSQAQEPDLGIARRARFFRGSYPVREMIKRGWLEDSDPAFLEAQMVRFFEVNKVEEIPHLAHAARKTDYDEIAPNQLSWLFRVRQIAKSIAGARYSEKRLRQAIPHLKTLMEAPEEVRHVPRILMDCGVRYVLVETLPGGKIDGVCFWLGNSAPVIGMSVRFDRIDNFWFVLRHEIEHVLQKHGRDREVVDIELLESDEPVSQEEQVANNAAANFCVPEDRMISFIDRKYPYISERDVLGFAASLHLHPGVVVGRLHHKTREYKYFRKYLGRVREHLLPNALVDGWGHVAPVNL